MATDLEQLTLRIEANTKGVDNALKALNRNMDRQFKVAENRASSFEKHISAVGRSALGVFATFGTGLGAMQLAQGLGATALELDRVNKALVVATGSSAAAKAEFEFIRATSNALGLELMSTAQQYAFLAAAAKGTALEGQATRDIFTGVATAASSLGLTAANTAGVLNAVQQMISKGVVSAEELRQQFGERLPGGMAAAERAMGMTNEELAKALESGQILATDLLPKLAVELMKMGDAAGSGLQAELNRLNNAWTDLQIAFANTGAIEVAISALKELTFQARQFQNGGWGDFLGKIGNLDFTGAVGTMIGSRVNEGSYKPRGAGVTVGRMEDGFPKPAATKARGRATPSRSGGGRGSSGETAAQREAKRDAEQYTQAVADLNRELGYLSISTDAATYAQQLHSNLQRAGVTLDEERGQKIAELTARTWDQEQAIQAAADAQEHAAARAQELGDMWATLGDMASGALEDIIVRGEDAGEVIGRLLIKIAEMIALQSISGSGPFAGVFGDIFGRAGGGAVNRGQPYLVGEQGPELFVPPAAGQIMPKGRFGGGGTVINLSSTINAPGANPSTLALMQQMLNSRDAQLRRELPALVSDKQRRNQLGGAFR
jgi:tape measure domain-containing protein